jgi:hypothetical protein
MRNFAGDPTRWAASRNTPTPFTWLARRRSGPTTWNATPSTGLSIIGDPTLLDRKLKQGGFGLLIVERDSVFEVIKPVEQSPNPERVQKVISSLAAFHKVDLD